MNTQASTATTAATPMTGAELETMLRAIGWTVNQLADHFSVADRSAKYWERGRGGVPDDVALFVKTEYLRVLDTASKLADASLGVAPGVLFLPLVYDAPKHWPNMPAAAALAQASLQMQNPAARVMLARVPASHACTVSGRFDPARAAQCAAMLHESQAQAHKNSTAGQSMAWM